MNAALWILQVVLAIIFLWHGWLFVSPPTELLAVMNALLAGWFRVLLGVAEILAAIGLVLPSLTRIQPWFTPLAAAGLMIVMLSASVLHFSRGETSTAITTVVLFALVTVVAYTRWKIKPIAPRVTASA